MTYEEVLSSLREQRYAALAAISRIGEAGITRKFYTDRFDVLSLEIDACSKMVQVKPEKDGCYDICPNCGSYSIREMLDGGYEDTLHRHCPDCGQAIDWSQVENWQGNDSIQLIGG